MKNYNNTIPFEGFLPFDQIESREAWQKVCSAEEQIQKLSIFGKELKETQRRI